jgi:hypothetical protein
MKLNVDYRVRVAVYIVTAVGTPIIAYLLARAVIGSLEVTLWSAEVAVAGGLAALNVTPDKEIE